MSSDAESQLEVERTEQQHAGKTKSGEADVAANGEADARKALSPWKNNSEEDEEDLDDESDELQVVTFTERPRPRMTAMKSTGGGFGRTIRYTAMKSTGGYSAYTRKAPPPAVNDSEEDHDDEPQIAAFRGRAPMTAMKSTGVGVRRTIRRTAMKCTGGGFARRARNAASAYTRKAPPPAEDDSEEDDEDLDDAPQLAISRGRPRIMTAMKSTGGGFGRTVRRTAMKCTGGSAAYTRKAPPPSEDDLEEDEEDEEFEGEDGSGGEDEAESDIADEDGMDKEQNEDDENGANGEHQTETESSNFKTKAGKFLEVGAEEAVTIKRKRLSD